MATPIVASRCDFCKDDPREFIVKSKTYADDLHGYTCERLTVHHFVGVNRHRQAYWCCSCACGGHAVVLAQRLKHQLTRSCGCLVAENVNDGQFPAQHGMTHTRIYRIWVGIRTRCLNPKASDFARYGGRGITLCDRWQESFEAFYADVGDAPCGMTLDRLDNALGYEPGNVAWRSAHEQGNNKRNNRLLTCEGKTQSLTSWARETGISYGTLIGRLDAGWDVLRVLTEPVLPRQSLPLKPRPAAPEMPLDGSRKRHGMSKTQLHGIWRNILSRCSNPKNPSYPRYGGRGITICEAWRTSFVAFFHDVGHAPEGMSLDRLDNDRGYEPGNVAWRPRVAQAGNKRSSVLLTYAGVTQCVAAWARTIGLPSSVLRGRLGMGWDVEKVLTTPLRQSQKGERDAGLVSTGHEPGTPDTAYDAAGAGAR